jgi:hypothetical protein
MAFWGVNKFLQCAAILSRSRCCKQKSVENWGGDIGFRVGAFGRYVCTSWRLGSSCVHVCIGSWGV